MNPMSANYRLPDIIGLGTRRCATSWLHNILNMHLEIGKPESGIHYFSTHSDKDLAWYTRKLAPYINKKVLIEFSVSYIYPEYCGSAAAKMYREVPDAKFFICVRNPVNRAYSDYLRSIRMAEIPAEQSFETCVSLNPIYLDRGHYATLLKPYLELFPKERFRIFFYEDLVNNPSSFVIDVANFLGVSADFDPNVIKRSELDGKTVRSAILNRTIRGVKNVVDGFFENVGYADNWGSWKSRYVGVYQKALEFTYCKQSKDQLFISQLTREFDKDILFLEQFTGRDIGKLYGS